MLRASDGVSKFHDPDIRDTGTGDCYWADHLLTDFINELLDGEAMSQEKCNVMIGLKELLAELT